VDRYFISGLKKMIRVLISRNQRLILCSDQRGSIEGRINLRGVIYNKNSITLTYSSKFLLLPIDN
jgi:hypothetical protein